MPQITDDRIKKILDVLAEHASDAEKDGNKDTAQAFSDAHLIIIKYWERVRPLTLL